MKNTLKIGPHTPKGGGPTQTFDQKHAKKGNFGWKGGGPDPLDLPPVSAYGVHNSLLPLYSITYNLINDYLDI